ISLPGDLPHPAEHAATDRAEEHGAALRPGGRQHQPVDRGGPGTAHPGRGRHRGQPGPGGRQEAPGSSEDRPGDLQPAEQRPAHAAATRHDSALRAALLRRRRDDPADPGQVALQYVPESRPAAWSDRQPGKPGHPGRVAPGPRELDLLPDGEPEYGADPVHQQLHAVPAVPDRTGEQHRERVRAGAMKAAVLGSPVGHSLSPVLHRAAYLALGLDDWSYEAIECDEARLPGLMTECGPDWAGLSLT